MGAHRQLMVMAALAGLLLPGMARAACDEQVSGKETYGQIKAKLACLARERDAARAEAAALRGRPAAGHPEMSLNIFSWTESDETCKVSGSKGLTAAGLKIIEIGKFSVRATDDSSYAAVVCKSPTFMVIVAAPSAEDGNALRDKIRAGM